MTPELKKLLTEQVRPEVLQQVFDLIEGKTITAEAFKNTAIECDNDEQMIHVAQLARNAPLPVACVEKVENGLRFFRRGIAGSYSNYTFPLNYQTTIYYTDFINQYK